MRDKLTRLAHEVPETRAHLVPLIRKYGGQCVMIEGGGRKQYEAEVWAMFVKTYSRIGLIMSAPGQMYKYAAWDVCLGPSGVPVAINLYKKTSFGWKSGLAGSDGSSEGKQFAVDNIRKKFHRGGTYGEVSHKVEAIAIASGAPAVCASNVESVLGKAVIPSRDGIHYTRVLQGVGKVTKIMLGRPSGVPVTDPKQPSCTVASLPRLSAEEVDEAYDLMVHQACLMQD